jgi:hypothetical protein
MKKAITLFLLLLFSGCALCQQNPDDAAFSPAGKIKWILKLNPLELASGRAPVAAEIPFLHQFSLELQAGPTFRNYMQEFWDENKPIIHFGERFDELEPYDQGAIVRRFQPGYQIGGSVRYYTNPEITPLHDVYIGLTCMSYSYRSSASGARFYHYPDVTFDKPFQENRTATVGGFTLGAQKRLLGFDHLLVDLQMVLGVKFVTTGIARSESWFDWGVPGYPLTEVKNYVQEDYIWYPYLYNSIRLGYSF